MAREALATKSAKPTTLGPLAYFMPLMPAVLSFGPLFLVMHTGNILAIVAAILFGAGLCLLWACMMRIAQRLDADDATMGQHE